MQWWDKECRVTYVVVSFALTSPVVEGHYEGTIAGFEDLITSIVTSSSRFGSFRYDDRYNNDDSVDSFFEVLFCPLQQSPVNRRATQAMTCFRQGWLHGMCVFVGVTEWSGDYLDFGPKRFQRLVGLQPTDLAASESSTGSPSRAASECSFGENGSYCSEECPHYKHHCPGLLSWGVAWVSSALGVPTH
eukprot:Polyplicarium_translucidae@DN4090_c0_g1_i1.p1